MEFDRDNMYDHIDASHRTLAQRINTLDQRCAQQVHAIDRLTKERLDQEHRQCEERIRVSSRRERAETDKQISTCRVGMRTDLQAWMDSQMIGMRGGNRVMDNRHAMYGRNTNCQPFQRGDVFNQSFDRRSFEREPMPTPLPGKLYRSKSDDTLSVSSSQAAGAHRLSRRVKARCNDELLNLHIQSISTGRPQPMQTISNQRQRKHRSRDNLIGGSGEGFRDRVWSFHDDVRRKPSGRSPEGHSGNAGEFSEYSSEICVDGDGQFDYDAWYNVPAQRQVRQYQEADGNVGGATSQSARRTEGDSCYQSRLVRSATRMGDDRPCPAANGIPSNQRTVSNERTAPNATTHVVQVHHSKADSSGRSNPDSGYGERSINGINRPPVPPKKPSLGPAAYQKYSESSDNSRHTSGATTTSACNTSGPTSSVPPTGFGLRTSDSKDRRLCHVAQQGRVGERASGVPETICAPGVITQSSCLIGANVGRATQV